MSSRRTVHIGETVCREATLFKESKASKDKQEMYGTVIYIHPLGRFHAVRFDYPRGRHIVECFDGVRG